MHRLNRCWWIVRSKSTTLKHPRNWILDYGIPFPTSHTPPRGGAFLLITRPAWTPSIGRESHDGPLESFIHPLWASFGYIASEGRRPRGQYVRDQGGLSQVSAVRWSSEGTYCQIYIEIGQGLRPSLLHLGSGAQWSHGRAWVNLDIGQGLRPSVPPSRSLVLRLGDGVLWSRRRACGVWNQESPKSGGREIESGSRRPRAPPRFLLPRPRFSPLSPCNQQDTLRQSSLLAEPRGRNESQTERPISRSLYPANTRK